MTYLSFPFAIGLCVRSVLKPKGFEDADRRHLPIEKRTDADTDGRADTLKTNDPVNDGFHAPGGQ